MSRAIIPGFLLEEVSQNVVVLTFPKDEYRAFKEQIV
jgi:hypothetical protein